MAIMEPGRGINFGGALDGDGRDTSTWLKERHFDVVREAGFATVRLPVNWPAHVGTSPPHAVERALFERVDWAIDCASSRGLNVVLTNHHDRDLCNDPDGHAARFLSLWSQIARRYPDTDPRLAFEWLNEPHEPMTAGRWNDLLARALATVRPTNPERTVIVGPARWNTVDAPVAARAARTARDQPHAENARMTWAPTWQTWVMGHQEGPPNAPAPACHR